jgi:hypothetical protein
MLGFYLFLIGAWFWFCLVFFEAGRAAILLPFVIPWLIFVSFGCWFFDLLENYSLRVAKIVGKWCDDLGKKK